MMADSKKVFECCSNDTTQLEKTIEMMKNDNVNHPSHYTNGDIECIEAIRASMSNLAYCGYLKGNVLKYLWRFNLKNNPVEDLKKANWYLSRLIKELEDNATVV